MKDLLRRSRLPARRVCAARQARTAALCLMPLLINVLLFGGLIWWAYGWVEATSQYLVAQLPDWLEWLSYLVVPVFVLTCLVLIFYGFSVLANLIAAPFNGLLAEAVESQLTGQAVARRLASAAARYSAEPVLRSCASCSILRCAPLPLLVLLLVPVVNVVASLLWVLFSAWMMTVQYIDYPMANHRLFFKEQRARLRKRPLLAWSFGGLVMLCTMIPLVNFFVMPAAVAGATVIWVREGRLQSAG